MVWPEPASSDADPCTVSSDQPSSFHAGQGAAPAASTTTRSTRRHHTRRYQRATLQPETQKTGVSANTQDMTCHTVVVGGGGGGRWPHIPQLRARPDRPSNRPFRVTWLTRPFESVLAGDTNVDRPDFGRLPPTPSHTSPGLCENSVMTHPPSLFCRENARHNRRNVQNTNSPFFIRNRASAFQMAKRLVRSRCLGTSPCISPVLLPSPHET